MTCALDGNASTVLGYDITNPGVSTGLSVFSCLNVQSGNTAPSSNYSRGRGVYENIGVVSEGCSLYAYTCTSTTFTLEIQPLGTEIASTITGPTTSHVKLLVFRVPEFTPFYRCVEALSEPESGIVVTPESLDDGDFDNESKSMNLNNAELHGLTLSPSFLGTLTHLLANHQSK